MWSRRVRVRLSGKVSSSAYGFTTDSGRNSRCALRCSFRMLVALLRGQQAFERLRLALQPVDGLRLLAVLVHRQHQAAVQQFLVDVDGRGRQEDHHRAFDAVLLRDQPPVSGSLPVEAMVSSPSLCSSFNA